MKNYLLVLTLLNIAFASAGNFCNLHLAQEVYQKTEKKVRIGTRHPIDLQKAKLFLLESQICENSSLLSEKCDDLISLSQEILNYEKIYYELGAVGVDPLIKVVKSIKEINRKCAK